MSFTAGLAAWKIAFQLSPIILTGGIAQGMSFTGQMLPILAITEAINFPLGLLSGGENIELDDFFANYRPVPGSTIIDQDIGHYPFANQTIAANAVIQNPLQISMQMVVPARNAFGYYAKLATMTAFQLVLQQHNASGGTYVIMTPSYIYTNCVMRGMRDASQGSTNQPQNTWQLDFEQPLLTIDQTEGFLNSLMAKITSQTEMGVPTLAGAGSATGSPTANVLSFVLPSATGNVPASPPT